MPLSNRNFRRIPLQYMVGIMILYHLVAVQYFNLYVVKQNASSAIEFLHKDGVINEQVEQSSSEETSGIFPPGTKIDGTFNNHEITYVIPKDPSQIYSKAHCIGEAFNEKSWTHRSCRYSRMCFDLEEKEFVVFQSPSEQALDQTLQVRNSKNYYTFTSTLNISVSLGSINTKWNWNDGIPALEYRPKVITDTNEIMKSGYYQLAPGKLFLPFHSFAAVNVGHLMWDDFLPIYLLLSTFQLHDNASSVVLMRYVLKHRARALWATCDLRDSSLKLCKTFFKKFLPLMGIIENSMRSTEDSQLVLSSKDVAKTKFVCADTGLAGIGMFSDHGLKAHGWDKRDYFNSHNIGRAPVFRDFRKFMMNNVQIDPETTVKSFKKYKITFSHPNSKHPERRPKLKGFIEALEKEFGTNDAIEWGTHFFEKLDMESQVRLVSESSILVTVCGGGAVTSMFLPKGSTLILLYNDYDNQPKKHPARLDWDYFNNLGDYRVHWLPIEDLRTQEGLNLFIKIVKHELEMIMNTNI